ncbi:LarC family nickel insertion protein [Azospirillum sp.]|uniref:LarC family nickel insertion protein n=1 Tax=Azospirillum sp. TaxID=34012 RepID=UPI002D6CC61C|nr:LarC family nickel insertion protein [Azospirillum sp.]HYD68814.1 LarC family nickel insertion protein [Azospirillum sp.]
MNIHLDAVGGVAGDMFAAALLDARPDLWPDVADAVAALGLPEAIFARMDATDDGVLTGRRFQVHGARDGGHHHGHDHGHDHGHANGHTHDHVHWRDIRGRLESAPLRPGVRGHAVGIFSLLAEAEAAIHGRTPDDVAFHEVGAVDSIVDIVAAAALIDALAPAAWSIGPVPRGSGLVRTAHGILPVPAPATARLLNGFVLSDDDEDGERTTPTGAAILAWLKPAQRPDRTPRRLLSTGTGFGTRRLKHRPNILRAMLFGADEGAGDQRAGERTADAEAVGVLRFEVDDQTAEDLAVALDRIRAVDGVLDVCQWPVFGKKGRMAAAVQILTRPEAEVAAVSAALEETTTLGVRRQTAGRATLPRAEVEADGVPVKLAVRPGGARSAKAAMDALAPIAGAANRASRRAGAEKAALDKDALEKDVLDKDAPNAPAV